MSLPLRERGCQLALSLVVAACSANCAIASGEAATPGPAPEARVQTTQGSLVGFRDGPHTLAWLCIPFAQPPVGPLRWRAPRAPSAWSGERTALRYAAHCPQWAGIATQAAKSDHGKLTGAEDCLYLNVWSPSAVAGPAGAGLPTVPGTARAPVGAKPLPVMVCLHGGGNSVGTANTYSDFARSLAGGQQVLVVTLNYRLGMLGWFSHPALAQTSTDADPLLAAADRSGNFGTLDIIAALRWVRGHIAAFGGDPDNVTVFGESAGGYNVYSLLASPLARGLFHKAIAQSGGLRSVPMALAQNQADAVPKGHRHSGRELALAWRQDATAPAPANTPASAAASAAQRRQAQAWIDTQPADAAAAWLRGLTVHQLFKPLSDVRSDLGLLDLPALFQDGVVLPAQNPDVLLAQPGALQALPLITGSNRDEMKTFLSGDPAHVRKLFGVLPMIRDAENYERVARLGSEVWRLQSADLPAAARARAGLRTFVYRFDFDQLKDRWFISLSRLLGAGHGLEMHFAFGLSQIPGLSFDLYDDSTLAQRQQLAQAMSSYWAQFAYTGDPGRGRQGKLPPWLAWQPGPDQAKALLFDAADRGGIRQARTTSDLAGLQRQLAADPQGQRSLAEYCRNYPGLFRHSAIGTQLCSE